MKYHGLVIGDIHIGAFSCEKLYEEFKQQFLEYAKKMNQLDFIIIVGDYFDHKFFLNDNASTYSHIMLQDMINLFQTKKDVKIRFVYGTESHECNQYNTLLNSNLDLDIKLMKYAEEEELFPGVNVLYLPEEQISSKEEYYKDFLQKDKYYSYIFGHGVIRETMKVAAAELETKDVKHKKVPVFSTAELHNMCKGKVYFGHYHTNTDMGNVYYVGSFSRWKFGEEEAKGFYEITCNTEKEKYNHKFIENTSAETYKTIGFGYENAVFDNNDNMELALDRIDKLIETKALDHVRFEFNISQELEDPEFIINYLKERYKFNKAVKLEITNGYIENKREIQKKEIEIETKKHSFIFDKNTELHDKSSQFIAIEYNRDVPSSHIEIYLYKPLTEILEIMNKEFADE